MAENTKPALPGLENTTLVVEEKPKISVTPEEYKDLQKNYSSLTTSLDSLQSDLSELNKPFEPRNIENSFVTDVFGYKLVLPREKPKLPGLDKPKLPGTEKKSPTITDLLLKPTLQQMGLTEDLLKGEDSDAIYHQNLVREKLRQDAEYLKDATPDEISEFVKTKKQNLLSSTPLTKTYEIDRGYNQVASDLDKIAQIASFNNAPYLHKNIDQALALPNEELLKNTAQIGNDIQNINNDISRATFKATADTGINLEQYDQLYKDKLAYLGIQSEINATYKGIEEDSKFLQEKTQEVETLIQDLQNDPTNKDLIEQIKVKSQEVQPITDSINKKKAFITKLSEASLELPEFDRDLKAQIKADQEDLELQKEFGASVGRPVGIAVRGLANHLTSTLKGAALVGNELSKSLGRNPSEAEIIKQNLLLDKSGQFEIPSRIKYGKAIEVDFKEGKTLPDIDINWDVVAPVALQTTGEMLMMGTVAAPLSKFGEVGKLAGLYAGATAVFGGDILQRELEKGLSFKEASAITGLRLLVEAASERLNPIETIPFNGVVKPLSKTVSKADFINFVGKNWQNILPKLKAKGIDVWSFLKNASKSMVLEPVEEVMADLGNVGIDEFTVNNIKPDYRRDNEFTLSNELETALTTALTMAPMSVYSGIKETQFEKQAPNLRYKAATNPDLFLTNLEDNFKKGNITKQFYETGKKEVETASNLYNNNKTNLRNFSEEEQIHHLDNLYKYNQAQQALLKDPTNEDLIKTVEKSANTVADFNLEATKLQDPQERFKKSENTYIQNLKGFASPQDLKDASLQDLNIAKNIIQDVVSNPFSPKVREQAIKQIEDINNEIAEKSKPAPVTPKDKLEAEKQRISKLSQEELIKERESLFEREDAEQIAPLFEEREKQLLDEANTITFKDQPYKIGEWVKRGDEEAIYKVEALEPDGRLKVKFADNSQSTHISPSDVITKISPEEAQKILKKEEIPVVEEPEIEDDLPIDFKDFTEVEKIFGKAPEDTPEKVEQVKQEIVEETKTQEEQQVKEIKKVEEFNAKRGVNSIVGTVGQTERIDKDGNITRDNDPAVKLWDNTLASIRQEGGTSALTGYYVSVVSATEVPDSDKRQSALDWEAGKLGKAPTKEQIANTRYAVITDINGKFVKFNTEGQEDTNGKVAHAALPVPYKEGDKLTTKLELQPNIPQEEIQGALRRLQAIRHNPNKVYEISSITTGVPSKSVDTSQKSLSESPIDQYDIVIPTTQIGEFKKGEVYVKFKDSDSRIKPKKGKIGDDLAIAIANFVESYKGEDYWNKFNNSIEALFYNKRGGKLYIDGKSRKFYSENKEILWQEFVDRLAEYPINISNKLAKGDKVELNAVISIPTMSLEKGIEFQEQSYKTFLASKLSISKPTEYVNPYLVLGNEVSKEVPIIPTKEEIKVEPKQGIPENPVTNKPKKKEVPKKKEGETDFFKDDLQRSREIPVIKTTPQQEEEAKQWWNNSPLRPFINFRDFRNIVNSDAWATFSTSATTLWKGGKFTDLYHEAWHNFTQLALTKQQKEDLYNELINVDNVYIRNTIQKARDKKKTISLKPIADVKSLGKEYMPKEDKEELLNSKIQELLKYAEKLGAKNTSRTAITGSTYFYFGDIPVRISDHKTILGDRQRPELIIKWNSDIEDAKKILKKLSEGEYIDYLSISDKYKAVEELLAEDFMKYVLSGQKLILNNRPKRNTIFRKIYNFLKELITGRVDLQTYYERLYKGNINKYLKQLNTDNALFGTLNRAITNKEGDKLGLTETKDLMAVINRAINLQYELKNKVLNNLFTQKGELSRVYNWLGNTYFYEQHRLAVEEYNDLADKWEQLDDRDLANFNRLQKDVNNLEYIIDNWTEIAKYHKDNDYYLKLSKEAIDDSETDEEENSEQVYDKENTVSERQNASYRILYMIASLAKHESNQEIANNFISTYFKEEKGKREKGINPDIVDFDRTWNLLSKTLHDINDYNEIWSKLQDLVKTNGEFKGLIEKLPNPTKELTKDEIDIKTRFIQDLSKPLVQAYRTKLYLQDGELHAKVVKSGATVITKIKNNLYEVFQNQEPSQFITNNPTTRLNELNTEAILKEFPKSVISNSAKQRLNFLKAIGFEFSPNTIPNLEDKLNPKKLVGSDNIIRIYEALEQFNEKKIPITRPLSQLSKGTKEISGVQSDIDTFIDREAEFNDQYYTDNILNANGDNKYQIQQWSLQTIIYNLLNDVQKYPTYDALKDSPLGYVFDTVSNPDADNIYLNSIFDLKTGNRRTDSKGNPIIIQLIEQDGLSIQGDQETEEGAKSVELSRQDKFLQNFVGLLTQGLQSHVRVGDKNSEKATRFDHFVNKDGVDTGFLPVLIKDFVDSPLPNSAKAILKKILISELTRSKDVELAKDVKNLNTNIKDLGLFDGIIKGELWQDLKEQLKSKTPQQVIVDNNSKINVALEDYFKKITKENEQELGDNTIPKEIIWTKETALRAFTVNSWIITAEQIRLQTGDIRFYPAKEGKIEAKREPFKRFSKATSTGNIFNNDQQTNDTISKLYPRLEAKKAGVNDTEKGYIPSVIFNDQIKESAFIENYRNYWLKVAKQSEKIAEKLIDPFKNINIGDGQGWITLDEYRSLKLREGSDHWTDAHEEAYKEAINPTKPIDFSSLQRFNTLFSVFKVRYTGWVKDPKTGLAIPVDYKFSLLPLHPQAIKNTEFEPIHQSLIKQGVGIALFESGSKHSAILNPDGKFNNFEAGEYTINPLNYEFLFDVLNVEPEFKDEIRDPVQKRRLLYLNQFDNGVPIDYKKANWESLSEEQKRKESPIYKSYKNFERIISEKTQIEIDNLLNILGAKEEKDGNYTIDENAFSQLLEEEFLKRGLPDNVIESVIVTEDGKFKYPLDASVVRQTIESIVLSIVDNRIRKQKSFGEGLVVASDAGFNLTNPTPEELAQYGTTDLASYQYQGRTLPDGKTKVTSPSMVKLSIGIGDFKKLLKLTSQEGRKFQDYPNPLQELNKALKDPKFREEHRQLLSLTADKIPIQGHNSMEFFEVYEFLPEGTTALILAPEIVAKSGVDFDVDKLFTILPSIFIDENDNPKLFTELSDNQIDAKYDALKQAIKDKTGIEWGATEESTEETKEVTEDLLQSIFGSSVAQEIKDLTSETFGRETIPTKASFRRIYKKAALNNALNTEIRKVLQQSSNFGNLMHPNSTEMFEPYADELRLTKLGKSVNYWSDIVTQRENLNQLASSWGSRASLGIGAVANTFFSQLQSIGMYLSPSYQKYVTQGAKVKPTFIRLPHNTVKVDGKTRISISGKYDWRKNAGKPPYNTISEAISQLMNGWVDAAKKDWVYYMNGIKEIAPTQLYMLMVGIDNETMVSFTNQPVIDFYIQKLKNNRSLANRLINRQSEEKSSQLALFSTYEKYIPWKEGKFDSGKKNRKGEPELRDLNWLADYTVMDDGTRIPNVYIFKNEISGITSNDIFNNEYLKPIALGEKTPNNLDQAKIITHFLELKEQADIMTNLQSATSADRTKPAFIYASNIRKGKLNLAKQQGLFPPKLIDKLTDESTISAFLHQQTGIDALITKLFSGKVFDVTNHPNFNKFIEDKWNTDKDIPFSKKFENQEDYFKKIKNDFILFLYQNYVHEPNSTEMIVDKVRNLMKRGKNSLGNQLIDLIQKYPDLAKTNTLLNQLTIDNSTKQQLTNIKLKKDQIDRDLANLLTNDFNKLLNFSEYEPTDNQIIQQFAKNLAHFGFIQSGLSKSPYYFTNIIPQDFYANNISDAIKDFSNKLTILDERTQKSLEDFYRRFKQNNAYKFYVVTDELDESGQVSKNITPTLEPSRFSNYIVTPQEGISDRAQITAAQERAKTGKAKQELYNKVDTYNPEATDASKEPDTLFIYESVIDNENQNTFGSAKIKKDNSNVQGIPVKQKTGTRDVSYLKDEDFLANRQKIDQSIQAIKDRSVNYGKILFPSTGFNTEISKLKEKAPKTFEYLTDQLALNFNYNDINGIPLLIQDKKILSNEDVSRFKKYLDKSIKKPAEFFTEDSYFSEFYNNDLGYKGKAPQSSKWILQSNGYYNLVDKDSGEVYIENVNLETGYKYIDRNFIPLEEIEIPMENVKAVANPQDYTNYSGDAEGGDKFWAEIGKEFNISKTVNYYPSSLKKLTAEQLKEVEDAYQKAVKDLGRYPLAKDSYGGGLVRRDYLQAKAGEGVFAISTILEPNQKDKKGYTNKSGKQVVEGGTGYAVQMAINLGKPVYVFDQLKNQWFKWENNDFIPVETPILTTKFTGIGTREITEKGKQAIRDVYNKTFKEQPIVEETKKEIKEDRISDEEFRKKLDDFLESEENKSINDLELPKNSPKVGEKVTIDFTINDKIVKSEAEVIGIQFMGKSVDYGHDYYQIQLKNTKSGKIYNFDISKNGIVFQQFTENKKFIDNPQIVVYWKEQQNKPEEDKEQDKLGCKDSPI